MRKMQTNTSTASFPYLENSKEKPPSPAASHSSTKHTVLHLGAFHAKTSWSSLVYSVPNPEWGASVPPELLEDTKPNLTARPTLAFLLHLGREHLHFSSFAMQCFASIRHLHLHLKPGARANVHHLLPPGDVHKIHRDIGNLLASISWGRRLTSATQSHPAKSKEWGSERG